MARCSMLIRRWNSSGIGGFQSVRGCRRRRRNRGGVAARTLVMIAARTSASSGLITSRRSVSVFEGAICSSGTSSPVPGRVYWMRL